jgi:hypothetical protein
MSIKVVRISRNKEKFNTYMNTTDDLQKSDLPSPSTEKRYTLWGWKNEESEQWSLYRETSNNLMMLLGDPTKTGPANIKKMNVLIKEVRAFDNSKINGHHLLDKVASFGSVDDQIAFNVRRGTVLDDPAEEAEKKPEMMVPSLSIIEYGLGQQLIGAAQSDATKTIALPEGIKFLKIYRFIGVEKPQSTDDYHFLGNAKRGRLLSSFEGVQAVEGKTLKAYYLARYESNIGELSGWSAILESPVMLVE